MSFAATRWAKSRERLRGSYKAVLIELAARANADGIAFPSLRRLAADLGYCVRTIGYAIEELLAQKLIEKVMDPRERETLLKRAGARFVSLRVNVYRLCTKPADAARRGELPFELPIQARPQPAGANLCTPECEPLRAEPAPAEVVAPPPGSQPQPPVTAAGLVGWVLQILQHYAANFATESFTESSLKNPPLNPPRQAGGTFEGIITGRQEAVGLQACAS